MLITRILTITDHDLACEIANTDDLFGLGAFINNLAVNLEARAQMGSVGPDSFEAASKLAKKKLAKNLRVAFQELMRDVDGLMRIDK